MSHDLRVEILSEHVIMNSRVPRTVKSVRSFSKSKHLILRMVLNLLMFLYDDLQLAAHHISDQLVTKFTSVDTESSDIDKTTKIHLQLITLVGAMLRDTANHGYLTHSIWTGY